jgi:hypothetical protein
LRGRKVVEEEGAPPLTVSLSPSRYLSPLAVPLPVAALDPHSLTATG